MKNEKKDCKTAFRIYLINILEFLLDDLAKFDEAIKMEQLEEGKELVLR